MPPSERVCSCKVTSVASRWNFEDVHDELERRWSTEGASVRDLTDEFNRRVLRAGFEESDRTPIDGEIDNLYRVLTDDDVDAGSRTQARERMRHSGIPIEEIEKQFISHQTLYRHLRDCLAVSRESGNGTNGERIEEWRERIRALQGRTATVADRGVEQLNAHGAVDIGSFDVIVDINVICNDCGRFYEFDDLLEGGTCECEGTDTGKQ